MKNVYSIKVTTDDTQADHSFCLPIHEILRLAEVAAFNHANLIGLDHETMEKKSNAFWIVSKMKLFLKQNVNAREKLTIKTWTHQPGLIRFDRDITIKSGKTTKAKITSEWCCLDFQTHRIRKADSVNFPELEMVEKGKVNNNYTNLKLQVDKADYVYTHTVRSTDIDVNKHTNNLKYTQFALDAFPFEKLDSLNITEYEIYFVNESHQGDNIDVYLKQQKNLYYIEGRVEDKTIFRSVIKTTKQK